MEAGKSRGKGPPPPSEAWLAELATVAPIGGVAGPGRWLVLRYWPTALFSLKASMATSSVGKSLLVPTAYAVKMALVDAAFRGGLAEAECGELLEALASVEVRIAPPEAAVVTHTFVKIRQEPKVSNPLRPYLPSIAYREVVYHHGIWRWAFDLAPLGRALSERIVFLAPRISYIGKRGSFIQFDGFERVVDITSEYTLPLPPVEASATATPRAWEMPPLWHPAVLDDFGPEASLEVLSTYSPVRPKVGKHRKYVQALVPLGVVSSGPGFTEYRAPRASTVR